ncbi:MAG: FG-GAP-like repeat-containing protein [bacterium]
MSLLYSWARRTAVALLFTIISIPALAHAAADLVVREVDIAGVGFNCGTGGATGTVAATIENLGDTSAGAGFRVLFFDDTNNNGAYDSGTDATLGEVTVAAALDPAAQTIASTAMSATFAFNKDLIFAFVDNQNDVVESNEANNLEDSGASCAFAAAPGSFDPVVEWAWTAGVVDPDAVNVLMTPCVIDLTGDGVPEVVFGSTWSTGGGLAESGYLRALDGATGAELFTVDDPALYINVAASIAVGDIDNDGLPEILAVDETTLRLIAFENDGTFKWRSDDIEPVNWGAPSIADIDQDGTPEIVIGRQALNNDGTLRWTGTGGIGAVVFNSPISIVADVDADGSPNVVAGNTVYAADGTIAYENTSLSDGLNAVANFDADPQAEIVLVYSSLLYLLEHDCTIKWGPIPLNAGGGGPPTVADYDGDGSPEIGIAGASAYTVFAADGTEKWSSPTQDGSSYVTGSSVFDFEGDGSAEVIYRDELYLRIYRGSDGTVLYQTPMSSCTWHEYVLVADVDADGNAEIVATANNNCSFGTQRGIYVIGDANDSWASTRKIWNQHTYHITNVNDDGTIPQFEENNWLAPAGEPYNNFRQNTLPGNLPLAAPNLTASRVAVDAGPCPTGVGLVARIGNGGSNLAAAPVSVAFYDGDPNLGGVLIGVTATTINLLPGRYEDVTFVASPSLSGPHDIVAVADDAGGGVGAVSECNETDNRCGAHLDLSVCATGVPGDGVSDGRTGLVSITPNPARTEATIAFSLPAPSSVALSIVDLSGRVVRSFESPSASAGDQSYTWDLRDSRGARVGAGVYVYRIDAGGTKLRGKVVVVQ